MEDLWSRRMTRYELVSLVASRVEQLARGAPSSVESRDEPLIATALREVSEGKVPLTIQRTMPDGSKVDLRASELILPKRTLQHMIKLGFLPSDTVDI